jgi:hypothetical protein
MKLVGNWGNKVHLMLELKKVPMMPLGLRTRQAGSCDSRVHSMVMQTPVLKLVLKMERRALMRLTTLEQNLMPLVGNWGNMVNLKLGLLMKLAPNLPLAPTILGRCIQGMRMDDNKVYWKLEPPMIPRQNCRWVLELTIHWGTRGMTPKDSKGYSMQGPPMIPTPKTVLELMTPGRCTLGMRRGSNMVYLTLEPRPGPTVLLMRWAETATKTTAVLNLTQKGTKDTHMGSSNSDKQPAVLSLGRRMLVLNWDTRPESSSWDRHRGRKNWDNWDEHMRTTNWNLKSLKCWNTSGIRIQRRGLTEVCTF